MCDIINALQGISLLIALTIVVKYKFVSDKIWSGDLILHNAMLYNCCMIMEEEFNCQFDEKQSDVCKKESEIITAYRM